MTVELKGMNVSRERAAETFNGYVMLLVALVLSALAAWRFVLFVRLVDTNQPAGFEVAGALILLFLAVLAMAGFYMIQPNQAAVITLFGAYKGTDRTEGLRWVWPWMMRKKLSARAHNVHSDRVKINDLKGNPIDIACNVVWRVADTAQAVFDVDDYKQFVEIQIEAGLRTVGARHPYDDLEEEEVTLRGSPDVVNGELQTELNERLHVAGIVVDEAGLTHLAYAAEIAGAMLRRQQTRIIQKSVEQFTHNILRLAHHAHHLVVAIQIRVQEAFELISLRPHIWRESGQTRQMTNRIHAVRAMLFQLGTRGFR